MIRVENLSYAFPKKDLYDNVSFTLENGQHCAFIGTSGSGKSTLIDIIRNPDSYMYDGTIEMDNDCRIGYISQFPNLDKNAETTVFEYISEKFLDLQNDIQNICLEMETSTELEPLLETYQNTLDAFNALDGDNYETNIKIQLGLAGLSQHIGLKISELSGGEFKLVQVIKEMLNSPNLLIMDEPDVFLDFENLDGLKNLINAYKYIVLVITHNRYLLNHCFDKIIHLEDLQLQEFDGRYINYNFNLLETKIELQELSIADDEEIARNDMLIDKLRESASAHAEASKGRSLKARVKIQERLEERRTKAPFVSIKQPSIFFETEETLEDLVALKTSDLSLSYDDLLIDDINIEIKANDKVALIGANGTGKTTLLRAIKNGHANITIDENIKMNFLTQLQGEGLNESHTVIDEFFDVGFDSNVKIRSYLLNYGIDEEILDQKIGSLSGGEKNLVQLAKVSACRGNFLLLDEPTSHLDTYAQLALESAIKDYNGTVVMVSHDYYTIINSMDYVLLIEDQKIRKMTLKKFKRRIYKDHYTKDYLELEQNKKLFETKIAKALSRKDYPQAKKLATDLGELINKM